MKRFRRAPFLGLLFAGLVVACSSTATDSVVATVKLAEQFRRLGDNLGQNVALLKSAAVGPISLSPADVGEVARVVKNVTGGLDIGVELKGKSGDKGSNIDGVGYDENVSIFVPDPLTGGTSTSATYPSFVGWKGDADSNDEGLCYLAWTRNASWFVVSKCGNLNGAYVCQVTNGESVCNACNTAGDCNPCDMQQSSFTCAWP